MPPSATSSAATRGGSRSARDVLTVAAAPATDDLRRAVVLDVLSCDAPQTRLLRHLTALDAHQDLASQAAVFEELSGQVDLRHFWILHRMHRVYADLGRRDLAFLMASQAAQIGDEPGALFPLMREMFRYHADRGEGRAAVGVFLRHAGQRPERPVADRWEIEPLARAIGLALDAPMRAAAGARRDRTLYPAETWTPGVPDAAAPGRRPVELERLAAPLRRDATVVAELPDAELFVRHDSLVTADRAGNLHVDLSLGPFPKLLADHVVADPAAERLALDEAVVLLDPFPAANLGHFLLDQFSRLGRYARAGARLDRAVVVGPRLSAGFQQAIAARIGLGGWLSTDRVARVRVGRLFVSTECRELQHPAQLCAPWNIAFLRRHLDGATVPGGRKLFVSRADNPARALMDEAALLRALEPFGFEAIVPGRLPYDAQLAAFRAASHVVACHGAALAHLVVCAPGTQVLEMFHPLYGTWAYAMLARVCGLGYAALVGRDGISDAPQLNDPDAAGPLLGRFGERGLRVEPAEVVAWARRTT